MFYLVFILIQQAFSSYAAAWSSSDIVASVNGETIDLDMIRKSNRLEIYNAEKALYDLQYASLRSLLIKKLISLDPASKGMTEDQYLSRNVIKPREISDQEVDAFIQSRNIPKSKINTNLKEQVRRFLLQSEIAGQIDQWVEQQEKKYKIVVNLKEPLEPRFEVNIKHSAYRGNVNAPVTIVEFSDFECPYCSRANETLYQLQDIYGDKIKIVYKHFPLSSIHPMAQKAAEATICAQEQGMEKFWELHNVLFENFRSLTVGQIKDFAKNIGLEPAAFNSCLTSGKNSELVQLDLKEGMELGVESTPAFFINGRFIKGALPLDSFKELIDEELAK